MIFLHEGFFILHSQTNLLSPLRGLQNFRTEYISVFDLSKQKAAIASQPIRVEFKFSAAFPVVDYVAYALVLTPKIIGISSDGQRYFDF